MSAMRSLVAAVRQWVGPALGTKSPGGPTHTMAKPSCPMCYGGKHLLSEAEYFEDVWTRTKVRCHVCDGTGVAPVLRTAEARKALRAHVAETVGDGDWGKMLRIKGYRKSA